MTEQITDTHTKSSHELLGYDEVAEILKISPRTLRRQVNSGFFPPPFFIGRSPRWTRDRIDLYLEHAQTNAEKGKKKRGVRRMLDGASK